MEIHFPSETAVTEESSCFPWSLVGCSYEDGIPDHPFPTLIVLGYTSGAAETMDDGVSVGYPIQTSDYVRDQSRTSCD